MYKSINSVSMDSGEIERTSSGFIRCIFWYYSYCLLISLSLYVSHPICPCICITPWLIRTCSINHLFHHAGTECHRYCMIGGCCTDWALLVVLQFLPLLSFLLYFKTYSQQEHCEEFGDSQCTVLRWTADQLVERSIPVGRGAEGACFIPKFISYI